MTDAEKKTTRKKKAGAPVEATAENPGTDFGVMNFSPVSCSVEPEYEMTSTPLEMDVKVRGLAPGMTVSRVGPNNQASITAPRQGVDGAFQIIVRPGERVAVPVSPVDITYAVNQSPEIAFETGLVFLGYADCKVFLVNTSQVQVVIRNGAKVATAVQQ